MIYKHRTKPRLLSGLLALEKRLSPTHEKYDYIKSELYKIRAGYGGEQEYDRYMKEVRTDYPHAILHDLSLQHEGVHFQIDSLFITPDTIIISEVKNIADKIFIKANPTQFMKQLPDGSRLLFRSPIAEVERKIQFLEQWLASRNIVVTVKGLIVFAYNNEMFIEEKPSMKVITAYEAPTYFRSLTPQNESLESRDIAEIAKTLARGHTEYNPFPITARYKIGERDIRGGVFCSECEIPTIMRWSELRWYCSVCGVREIGSHQSAVIDWFMLMSSPLTNRKFCEFTGITSRHTAKRMLARSDIQKQGKGRGSRYTSLT
ncbi:nuclease-related domain-containing protein [Sporosarcina gallistercoris]|uniref:nuclease-related domain-containing protein n=1 Tax=Sporosarcina gallistercoris TaxID=2762245 RepID=UPI003D2D62B9